MEKNTLKGKIKVLSYFAAFLFMVGVHMAMDRIGTSNQTKEELKVTGGADKDNIRIATVEDSIYNVRKGKSGTIMLSRTDYN